MLVRRFGSLLKTSNSKTLPTLLLSTFWPPSTTPSMFSRSSLLLKVFSPHLPASPHRAHWQSPCFYRKLHIGCHMTWKKAPVSRGLGGVRTQRAFPDPEVLYSRPLPYLFFLHAAPWEAPQVTQRQKLKKEYCGSWCFPSLSASWLVPVH